MVRPYDAARFDALTLYVATRSVGDVHFGDAKLGTVLFYTDFLAFVEIGDAVTGASYVRRAHGPYPSELTGAVRRLVAEGDAAIAVGSRFGITAERLVALRSPDLSAFSADEISLVDQVIDACQPEDGAKGLRHLVTGWQFAPEGDAIPYDLAWVEFGPAPADVLEQARDAAAELSLARA
jgi:hypothetical protein